MSELRFDVKTAVKKAEALYGTAMVPGEVRVLGVSDLSTGVQHQVQVLLVGTKSYRFFGSYKAANRWRVLRALPEVQNPSNQASWGIAQTPSQPARVVI